MLHCENLLKQYIMQKIKWPVKPVPIIFQEVITMKKLLTIILALIFVVSVTPVFAETYDSFVNLSADTADGNIPSYENGTEYTRHFEDDKNCVWAVNGDTVNNVSSATSTQVGVGSANTRIGVYKLPIPKIAGNQEFSKFEFNFSQLDTSGPTYYVLKMAGDDWTESTIVRSNPTMTEIFADATYNNIESEKLKYNALSVGGKINNSDLATGFPYTNYNRYVADITDYANECYKNGQNAIWVAVGCTSTKNIAGNIRSGYSTSPYLACSISFATAETGALEFVSADVEDGAIVSGKTATYTFTNKLTSAAANLNGENVECEVKGTRAFVSLNAPGVNVLSITATDAAGNSITTEEIKFRAGYNSHKITSSDNSTYVVDNSGSTAGRYIPQVNRDKSTVLTIPLPELSAGQTLGEFNLRFLMSGGYSPSYFRLFKIPVDASQVANLIQTSGETPEGKINIYEYQQAAAGEYKADFGSFESELYNTGVEEVNAGHADLTKYAKECIERGQTKMLVGFTSTSANSLIGVGDSSHTTNNRFHYSYWTVEDTDFTAKAPKFIASDDASTFADATSLTSLTKSAEYKFITSLTNFGTEDASVTLYIAQYDAEGTLIGVAPNTVVAIADSVAADHTSATLKIDAQATNVRAFIWNEANQKPMLIGDVNINAK